MFKIVKLGAYNFVHYKKLDIDFRSLDNLLFIFGKNLETSGAVSNGSGKSVIGDIITDLLFDKTIRGHSPSSFIGKFDKYSYSYVFLKDLDEKKVFYKIKKYRNHPVYKDKVVFYKVASKKETEQLTRKKKADTYKVISEILGITWDTFRNRNYFGQRDFKRFLNVTDSNKADIIVDIQNLHDLHKCKLLSHKSFSEFSKKAEDQLKSIDASRDLIAVLKKYLLHTKKSFLEEREISFKKISESISNKDKVLQELKYAQEQSSGLVLLRKKMSSIKYSIEQYGDITEQYNKVLDSYNSEKRILFSLKEKIGILKEEISAKEKLNKKILKGKIIKCFQCGARFNEKRKLESIKNTDDIIIENKRKIESLKEEYKEHKKKKGLIRKTKDKIESKKKVLSPLMKSLNSVLKEIRIKEKWENFIPIFKDRIKTEEKTILEMKTNIKNPPSKKNLLRMSKELSLNKKNMEKKEEDLEKTKQDIEKFQFAEKAYESAIRTLFDDFIDNLNYHSQRYLQLLSDDSIRVSFHPKKERKSKKIVDEINAVIKVNNDESRDFKTYSGGEIGKVEIATQLALFSSSSTPFPFIFLDEPFHGIDEEGRDRIVEILKNEAENGTRVIVISHEQVPFGYGDRLTVVRENGESYIE